MTLTLHPQECGPCADCREATNTIARLIADEEDALLTRSLCGVSFLPLDWHDEVQPPRWFEFAMPWRWSRAARTISVFTNVSLLEVSFSPPPRLPWWRRKYTWKI